MKSNVNKSLKTYNKEVKLRKMTLIIGARCKDGVVLIADKKVVEGTISTQEKKITAFPFGVAISGAGYSDFFDKFSVRLKNHISHRINELEKLKDKGELQTGHPLYAYTDDFITDCETILIKLKEDSRSRR